MKRIIKFRAKRLHNGEPTDEWVYGSLRGFYGAIDYNSLFKDDPRPEFYSVGITSFDIFDPKTHTTYAVNGDTIGQFTGFYDIHGTEVYEGDILQLKGGVTATVEWSGYAFHFYGLEDVNGRRPDYLPSRQNQMSVIGNIHDKK